MIDVSNRYEKFGNLIYVNWYFFFIFITYIREKDKYIKNYLYTKNL